MAGSLLDTCKHGWVAAPAHLVRKQAVFLHWDACLQGQPEGHRMAFFMVESPDGSVSGGGARKPQYTVLGSCHCQVCQLWAQASGKRAVLVYLKPPQSMIHSSHQPTHGFHQRVLT